MESPDHNKSLTAKLVVLDAHSPVATSSTGTPQSSSSGACVHGGTTTGKSTSTQQTSYAALDMDGPAAAAGGGVHQTGGGASGAKDEAAEEGHKKTLVFGRGGGERAGGGRGPRAAPSAQPREQWHSNTRFVLASIGAAIGLGNVVRFPYLAAKWNGAAFFLPYLISLAFLGIPILGLEFMLGQVTLRGATEAMAAVHPRSWGVGACGLWGIFLISTYYNVVRMRCI